MPLLTDTGKCGGGRNCLSFKTVVGGIEPPSPRLTVRRSTAQPPLPIATLGWFANIKKKLMYVWMKCHWNVFPCRDFCTGGPWWTDDTTVGSEDQHGPHSESSSCVRPGAVSCWKTSKKGRFIVMLNILQNILCSLINPARKL